MSSVNVRKSLLAFLLAILLVASMLPLLTYSATAAAKYYSATGTVTDATMNTITILKNGRYRTFGKTDAKILKASDGISLQDIVKIVYNENNPKDAVQIVMVSHNPSPNRRPHETNTLQTVTGVVNDAGMSTITITTPNGSTTFDKEDAHVLNARDGLLIGDTVRVAYYNDNPNVAVQIFMVSHGSTHRTHDWNQPDVNDQFSGEVVSVGDGYFTCQGLQTGITMTFYYNVYNFEAPPIQEGDIVTVMIDNEHPGLATRVIVMNSTYYS